ncbi:hypothetical protein BS636_06870 [Acinetobacter sp. LoGeW2-3]|uniref:hypothetical protein n=1 Tax=Acinetobacter sp. LoGeW2-3 TaxID=1808001 RepID=UPI000C05A906|nr:hypothetical protein [Acinetobacter sp. LoGeW2-3]ATO19399.1 hypothetical protein BS636_06870 [Acinetobacter sp. LoGeW2-3]
MKFATFKTGILSLSILFIAQFSHAVVAHPELVNTTAPLTTTVSKPAVTVTTVTKSSPIEKAIQQQKTEKKLHPEENLKVLTAIKVRPSQNFFAEQNQSFSRFLQSFFFSSNS